MLLYMLSANYASLAPQVRHKPLRSAVFVCAGTHVPDVGLLSAAKSAILCILKPYASSLSPELHGYAHSQTCKLASLHGVEV